MKKYGIRVTMPSGDPLAASHLLGTDWEYHRWFETAEERDEAFAEMQRPIAYYRPGDRPSQELAKVER